MSNAYSLANRTSPRDIIEAIRKNGWTKIQGNYIQFDGERIIGACAFGQAALNLAPEDWSVYDKYDLASHLHTKMLNENNEFRNIVSLNDTTEMTLAEIADAVEKYL